MKTLMTIAAVLWVTPVFAQAAAPDSAQPAAPKPKTQITGSITPGVQQFDNSTNSSKLTEYRDVEDKFYVPHVTLGAHTRQSGWFFDVDAVNLTRDDQAILARAGRPGIWSFQANWVEVPHHFSNKALTPYSQTSPGVFEVPANVPITFKKLATSTAADALGVQASDQLIAAYQSNYLVGTPLATQTNAGRFSAAWSGSDALTLGVTYDLRDKSGLKTTYGPIGDRPPRTLNIQLTEPVDYRTNDLTFSAEHQGSGYQLRAEYLFSDFANQIDTLQWENVYANPAPGATYDNWDRSVSAFGARPLPPDNRYHNVMATFGGDLPKDSRFTASASYGRLEQNEVLLPYSYNIDRIAVKDLPRSTADAQINTTNVTADYVISPMDRLNLRAFYRRYDLTNKTPSSRWQYVTSDTSGLTGTVSYVNKRVSLPYAWDRQNLGAEATWQMPKRSSLTLGYELEDIGREHREADTSENVFRASWRTRASRYATFEARFLQGMRDGGEYNNTVTHEGYWYAPSDANDNNNPLMTFDNHPDMRRYDVSDRLRRQFEVRANLSPGDVFNLSAFVRYRNDDFDSDVAPAQPLLETTLADRNATTPGNQLGLLEDARTRYGADLFVQPNPRLSMNAFVNYDLGASDQRSIEFNENNKANPGAIATAELGPWTRAGSEWSADTDDRTWNAGVGFTFQLAPERLTLVTDYTLSLGDIDITYGGYGVTNWDGTPFPDTHQFAFSTPPTIRQDLHVANVRFEIPLRALMLIVGYSYENYRLDDWQEGATGPWVEAVGADTFLRDSSRSYQWGNRLFNLGTYLAPSYDAHIGFVGFRYRF